MSDQKTATKAAKYAHDKARRARSEAASLLNQRNGFLVAAYEAGATIPELAIALGVSTETISVVLGRPRLASGKRHMPDRP
jgi:hypothetical protein